MKRERFSIKNVAKGAVKGVGGVASTVGKGVGGAAKGVGGAASTVGKGVGGAASAVGKGLKTVAGGALGFLKSLASKLKLVLLLICCVFILVYVVPAARNLWAVVRAGGSLLAAVKPANARVNAYNYR